MTYRAEDLKRLDCLLTWGPRRPDWTRTGSPSICEWAEMMWAYDRTMEGYPMMSTAELHIQARLQSGSNGTKAKQSEPVAMPRRLQDRPPFMADDDPLIGKVYR